jgi:hypothetical protein
MFNPNIAKKNELSASSAIHFNFYRIKYPLVGVKTWQEGLKTGRSPLIVLGIRSLLRPGSG